VIGEAVDRRVLGAVRFLDSVSGAEVADGVRVDAPGVRWVRNRRGWWVAAAVPGLEKHVDAFEQPPTKPARGSVAVEMTVRDGAGRYLPRRATLALPRDPAPARADREDSLFRPLDVALHRAPSARMGPGWAVVRVSAARDDVPAGGALLRLVRQDGTVMGTGMTDSRGEGVVAVAGVPVTTWEEGDGGVLSTEIDARLEVVWDPDGADPPDPDALEARREALLLGTEEVTVASATEAVVSVRA
jgi:hypothetical protein